MKTSVSNALLKRRLNLVVVVQEDSDKDSDSDECSLKV